MVQGDPALNNWSGPGVVGVISALAKTARRGRSKLSASEGCYFLQIDLRP